VARGVPRVADWSANLTRVPQPPETTWSPIAASEFPELVALAARCRTADGGLPLASDAGFLRGRWAAEGTETRARRDAEGRLLSAASLRPSGEGVRLAVLVDPSARDSTDAADLLDWGLRRADQRGVAVAVETEALTVEQAELFAARGLRQVFAEDVMHRDLEAPVAPARWPAGAVLHDWRAGTAARFFAVYEAAFRERPGFPGHHEAEWVADVEDDHEFRPHWSVLVELPEFGDAGFVTVAVDWIVQVGVVPAARGRGLATALVEEALTRLRAGGCHEAWLDVNVDNSAKELYRQLGFVDAGRRARFERV
jgi:ribosomal protein S18 acetylase RimI-like enzyme